MDSNETHVVLYTPKDIQEMFHLSRTSTYQLINSSGFPTIRLNKKIIIPKKELEKWLEKQSQHEYNY